MADVLITGASGFIGFHLAEALLRRGDQVAGLVRTTSNVSQLESLDIQLVRGDVVDVDSLRRAVAGKQVVYHLAGLTKARRRNDFFRVNEVGAKNIAAACLGETNPPTLINVSSLAAAGPARDGLAKRESDAMAPVSWYGKSKLAGEAAVRQFAAEVPTTIVRPPIVFGEADANFLQIVRPIQRIGIHTVPGYAANTFSLIHAADLASLLILAAELGERLSEQGEQGVYFAEAEERVSYSGLGQLIGDALERSVRPLPLPHAAIWLAAGVGQCMLRPFGKTPALNIDKAREATAGSWYCNCEKANTQLGFAPGKPLPERMRETINWYKSNGWL